jgi:hypothetical protein
MAANFAMLPDLLKPGRLRFSGARALSLRREHPMALRDPKAPGKRKMPIEKEASWLTNACIICGGVLGAGLGLWWRDVNGAVFGSVLGILFGYALSKPNLDTTESP